MFGSNGESRGKYMGNHTETYTLVYLSASTERGREKKIAATLKFREAWIYDEPEPSFQDLGAGLQPSRDMFPPLAHYSLQEFGPKG